MIDADELKSARANMREHKANLFPVGKRNGVGIGPIEHDQTMLMWGDHETIERKVSGDFGHGNEALEFKHATDDPGACLKINAFVMCDDLTERHNVGEVEVREL